MITYQVLAGTVDVSVVIRIIDSADGTPETGVVFNTSGIDLEYRRELEASVDITEATLAALTTAHTDGGFLHIGNGYYRLDLPDAACAAGAAGVLVHGVVTGMVVIGCYINLTPVPADLRQMGGVAQSAADLKDFADDGYDPSTNKVQGVVLTDTVTTYTGNTPQTGDAFARLGAPVGASISADVAAVKGDTVDIEADTQDIQSRLPAALVSGRMDSNMQAAANDVITAAVIATGAIDADAIAANAIGASELAADAVTEIQAGLSTLDAAGVRTAVGLASANLDTQLGAIDDFLDTEVAAIKAKTDNLPTDPADQSLIIAATDAVMARLGAPAGASMSADIAALPTAGETADAVWDEAIADHQGAGSTGEALSDAGGAGTPPTASEIADEVETRTIAAVTVVNGLAANTVSAAAIASAAGNKIADHVIRRHSASARASSDGDAPAFRSMLGANSKLHNKVAPNGSDLEIFDETDAGTPFGTQVMTTSPTAEPIVALDTT